MNLESALDELYASPPEEFLATRKKLAKEVNPAIASRRKPTTAAYVLNQLARRHAEDVESLVDVGRLLARAQRHGGTGLREAIEKQRATVEKVTKDAALVMKELGVDPTAHLEAVAAAIHAALVDAATGAALEEGRLEKAPELGASFPTIDLRPEPDTRKHAPKPASTTRRADVAAAKQAKRNEAAAAKQAERAEAAAAKQAERAEAAAAKQAKQAAIAAARAEVSRAEKALRDARAVLRAAQHAK